MKVAKVVKALTPEKIAGICFAMGLNLVGEFNGVKTYTFGTPNCSVRLTHTPQNGFVGSYLTLTANKMVDGCKDNDRSLIVVLDVALGETVLIQMFHIIQEMY